MCVAELAKSSDRILLFAESLRDCVSFAQRRDRKKGTPLR